MSIADVPATRKPSPAYAARPRAGGTDATVGPGGGGGGAGGSADRGCALPRGTSTHTASSGSRDSANAVAKVSVKPPAVASSSPATLLPTAPAVVFAVWYHAKVVAIAFLPPFSAIRAWTAGSRTASETPCTPRTPNSCHGAAVAT
ncbi:hypothetical protein LN652_10715 [Nocardioides okcheonensis]|nr:hypothetical protein [Nocardioides okcheonensis]UFN46643.1 hypothetical protein LN652_10715 [Nocardioides okcheonensis]